jgi:hypothetical protein
MAHNEQTESWRGRVIAITMALYLILLSVATWRHTFWRDEAGAWLIGRDCNNFHSLWHVVHYEGHPPLWFLVMFVIGHLTRNPEWIKLPNLLATLAAAAMILPSRNLSIATRLGLIFSYFMLFEYGLIDRNYMIGIVFLVAAAMWLRKPGSKFENSELKVSTALSLAALTSVPALIVAVSLYAYALAAGARERWSGRRVWAMVLFGVCVLSAVVTIWPPADSGSILMRDQWSASIRLGHALRSVAEAYLPVPGATVHFWNVTLLSRASGFVEGSVGFLLAIALAAFFRRRLVRWLFVISSILLLAEMAFTGLQYMRHVGWLFVVFLLALLLEGDHGLRKTWRGWMLAGILLVQVGSGIYAAAVSVVHPFSSARQVAQFLQEKRLEKVPMVFAPGVIGLAVLAYLERPSAYYPERHGQGSYFVWDRGALWSEHMPTPAEMSQLSSDGVLAVLISDKPLSIEETKQLDVEEIGAFNDEIVEYGYYVYRRLPHTAPRVTSDTAK